jgi:hypothetical protein
MSRVYGEGGSDGMSGSKLLRMVQGVDPETGEVLFSKKSYIPAVLNEQGYRLPYNKRGARFMEGISFPEEMTDADLGRMTRLAKLMVADANLVGYRKRGGVHAYTTDELVEIIGLSKRRATDFIEKMLSLQVMQRCVRIYGDQEYEEYYINPAYFFAGQRISLNLYLLFRESLDPLLPKWVIRQFMASGELQTR